jgi:hypothetical protein
MSLPALAGYWPPIAASTALSSLTSVGAWLLPLFRLSCSPLVPGVSMPPLEYIPSGR